MAGRPLAGLQGAGAGAGAGRALDRPDAGRPRRRRDQGRGARRRRDARLGAAVRRGRRGGLFPRLQPRQARRSRSTSAMPADLARARRLAAAADVVVENFKVGGLARFGLDYAERRRRRIPGSIYASVTGFGQDGPMAARPGYDFIDPGDGRDHGPDRRAGRAAAEAGGRLCRPLHRALRHDRGAGGAAASGERTGRGQWIDLGLFDAQLAVLANQATNYLIGGGDAAADGQRASQHRALPGVRGRRRAAGDRLRQRRPVRAALRAGSGWRCTADPRFATNRDRLAHREALVAALAARLGGDAARRGAGGDGRRPGCRPGRSTRVAEAFAEPQAVARGVVQEIGGVARAAQPDALLRGRDRRRAGAAAARRARRGDPGRAGRRPGRQWPDQSVGRSGSKRY